MQEYWHPLSQQVWGEEEIQAATKALRTRTTMGPMVAEFERQFAEYIGCEHAVMVNSGSSADLLLCLAIAADGPLYPGDTILIPAATWPTQAYSAYMAELTVKLVDVDPRTMNMDFKALEAAITDRVAGIFATHLLGNPLDLDMLNYIAAERHLVVLEDCCEALGAKWHGGRIGPSELGGTFSFFFSHHMHTMEGGMVVTDDSRLTEIMRVMRDHGRGSGNFNFVNIGLNIRPTEVAAAIGIEQLKKLDAMNARREELANRFFAYVASLDYLHTPDVHPAATPSWLCLPLMVSEDAPFERDDITAYLESMGIETRPIVAGNIAMQPVVEVIPELDGIFPGATKVHNHGFYIGLSPMYDMDQIDKLITTFERFFYSRR